MVSVMTHTQVSSDKVRTVKICCDLEKFTGLPLFHPAFLDKVALALKYIVCPTVRSLCDKFEFLLEIRKSSRIVFLESFEFLLECCFMLLEF